jgi:antitoxin ParD1/3/4
MNVSLTPEHEKYVQKKVASGKYASASEVVREGLRLLQETEQIRELRLKELQAKIDEGLADAAAGRLIDGPTAMKQIRARLKERIAAHKK